MERTYLFYDTETTGLSKAFDQVLHFAAIRTDVQLKEIKRYEIKIKLNPDVTPSPYALITHKMGMEEISHGMQESAAIQQIHQILNEPGTISVGYNTLGFDDEFLRFSFYRNLLPPYTHQYANQCGRMDIYPMTVLYYLFKNHALTWPQIQGKVSLKLEALNAANQFIQGRAHHAMVDVEATLELARRLMQERDMWDYLQGHFNKKIDNERTQPLQREKALVIDGIFGAEKFYQTPAIFLGEHRHYKNQSLWLRLDTGRFADAKDDLLQTTRVTNKKSGEPPIILPFKARFLTQLSDERIALAEENTQWLQSHPETLKELANHYCEYKYPVHPDTDADAKLYINGFWSFEEETFCKKFHMVKPTEKAQLTSRLKNPLLKDLAIRILGRHYPNVLDKEQAAQFSEYMNKVTNNSALVDYQGKKKLSPQDALLEIQELKKRPDLSDEDTALLNEYEKHLNTILLTS